MKSECYLLIKEKKEYFVVRVYDGFKDSTYFFEFSLKTLSLYPWIAYNSSLAMSMCLFWKFDTIMSICVHSFVTFCSLIDFIGVTKGFLSLAFVTLSAFTDQDQRISILQWYKSQTIPIVFVPIFQKSYTNEVSLGMDIITIYYSDIPNFALLYRISSI